MTARPSISWTTLTIDCADAETLGVFYSQLFGWEVSARDGAGWLQLRNPHGGISLNIQAEDAYEPPVWPEQSGHQAKMMHFEVLVDDLDAAVRLVLECGGTEALHQPTDRDSSRLRIMLDPAGHPFCLFVHGESRRPSRGPVAAQTLPRPPDRRRDYAVCGLGRDAAQAWPPVR